MTVDLTRRDAVHLAVSTAISFFLSQVPDAAAEERKVTCLIGQSGVPQNNRLCLGVLVTAEYDRHRQSIKDLRGRMKHRRILRPHSTDRYGSLFCRNFLDYMLTDSDLRFLATVVSVPTWPDPARERDRIVFGYHQTTLRLAENRNVARIDLVARRTLRSSQLSRSLSANRNPPPSVAQKLVRDDDLLQLAGYLANVVRAEGGKVKQDLRKYLKTKLSAPELDENNLRTHPKFRVREIFA